MVKPRSIALVTACVLAFAAMVVLAGCSTAATPQPVAASAESTPDVVTDGARFHTSRVKLAGDEVAVVTTNKGVIEFTLYGKDAPNTAASFVELAGQKYYDGIKWHRVVPSFVIQAGDPTTKRIESAALRDIVARADAQAPLPNDPPIGAGGPEWSLKAEFNSRNHVEGTVALARSQDPDSGGSQFYICLGKLPSLDGKYTVFGQVTKGMDVVRKIQVGDVIESVRIRHAK